MKILKFGLGLALLSVTSLVNAQKVNLKVANGQKITQVTTMESVSSFNVMGQDMENTSKTNTTIMVDVANATGTNTDVTMVTKKLAMEASMMGQALSYDSDKKDNDAKVEELFSKGINKPMTYTIDNNGSIIKEPKIEVSAEEKQMAMMSGGGVDNSPNTLYIKSLLNQDIKVGTTWKDSTDVKADVSVKTVNTYTVVAIEKDMAKINISATQTLSGKMEQMGMEMPLTGSTKITAIAMVDMKTGILLEKESKVESTTNIEANGMSIPVNGTVKTKIVNTLN
jgi:hypothetical protein